MMQNKATLTYSDLSSSLHNDLCDVINMMGPPTPIIHFDSARDDTTITSNYTQSSLSDNSNTSFVEVIIKNHHKGKKLKILEENQDKFIHKTVQLNPIRVHKTNIPDFDVQKELITDCQDKQTTFINEIEEVKENHSPERNNISKPNIGIHTCPHFKHPCEPCYLNLANSTSHNHQKNDTLDNEQVYTKKNHKKLSTDYNENQKTERQYLSQMKDKKNHTSRGIPKEMIINNNHEDKFKKKSKENTKKTSYQKSLHGLLNPRDVMERAELYYFDHGNSAYYHTTDSPPIIFADYLAEKTENAATRFWAQIFGMGNLIMSLVTSFILQLARFVLLSMVRPLTVGLAQIFSDYFLKPLLSVIFNAFIQPPLIFIFNILISLRDLCEPIAQAIGFFLQEIANVLRAFRLVEYKNTNLPKESQV